MDKWGKEFVEHVSSFIGDPTLDDEREDTTYTCRPEALKIAQLSFDKAVKEIDAVVRQSIKNLMSKAKSEEKKESLRNDDTTWCPIVGEIAVEYSNLAIRISKVLDTMDEWNLD